MRDQILAEIENMKQQQRQYAELHQQATGAIASLEWVLAQMEPTLTEKEFIEAVNGHRTDE